MVMTSVHQSDRSEHNVVQAIRKRVFFNRPATTVAGVVGKLPPGAVVVGGGVQVIVAFNDSGTDVADVGNIVGSTTTAAAFASAIVLSAVGYIAFDDLATSTTSYSDTLEQTLTFTYTGQNGNATAGTADVIFYYVTKAVV